MAPGPREPLWNQRGSGGAGSLSSLLARKWAPDCGPGVWIIHLDLLMFNTESCLETASTSRHVGQYIGTAVGPGRGLGAAHTQPVIADHVLQMTLLFAAAPARRQFDWEEGNKCVSSSETMSIDSGACGMCRSFAFQRASAKGLPRSRRHFLSVKGAPAPPAPFNR